MTKRQLQVCKLIQKFRYLGPILHKGRISTYMELQEVFAPETLVFSDFDMSDHTEVTLSNAALEEFEEYQSRLHDRWITRGLSICALVISLLSLLVSLFRS